MRGTARTPARDDPEPPRDPCAEAAALIAGAAELQCAGRDLSARLAAGGCDPDLVMELANLVMRYGENSAALREAAEGLRGNAYAVRHAYAAGAAAERDRAAAAAVVPRQHHRRARHAAGQGELFAVKGTAVAALGAAFRGSRAWAWLTSAHHAAVAAGSAAALAGGTALVIAAGGHLPLMPSHGYVPPPSGVSAPGWQESAVPIPVPVAAAVLTRPKTFAKSAGQLPVNPGSPLMPVTSSGTAASQPAVPSPSAPPAWSPPPEGQIGVSATAVDLGAGDGVNPLTATFTVTASGGPAGWRAVTDSGDITLSMADDGSLAAGASDTVTVTLSPAAEMTAGSAVIRLRPWGIRVVVTWEAAVVPSPAPSGLPSPLPSALPSTVPTVLPS